MALQQQNACLKVLVLPNNRNISTAYTRLDVLRHIVHSRNFKMLHHFSCVSDSEPRCYIRDSLIARIE